jgi:hypothetical protein
LYIQRPVEEDRRKFFQELILNQASMAPPRRKHTGKFLEELKGGGVKKHPFSESVF